MKYIVTSALMDRKSRRCIENRQETIDIETNPHFRLAKHFLGGTERFIELVYEEHWHNHPDFTLKVTDIREHHAL